ncbi:hypothetical protein KEM56_003851, partial [Ascosphaera pollenicola]
MSASPEHRANSPSAQGADIADHTSADVDHLHSENAQDAALEREVEESQPNVYLDSGDKKDAGGADIDEKEDLVDVDEANRAQRERENEESAKKDENVSDDESVLSDVDEEQFQDFDPANVEIDDRPQLAIDEENLKLIGRHKRSRNADGEWVERRKHREGRRERRSRKKRGEDEDEVSA